MRASVGQIFAHLLASKVELILCNDDEDMEGGTVMPAPQALTPRQQRPRCGGARQRRPLYVATATPQRRHDGAQGRRLLRVALRYPGVGSRFSLKQPPGAPYGGMVSAQGFLSRWSWSRRLWLGKDVCRLLPLLARASLGAAADRRQPPPRGAGALDQHQEGAGERPPFSTLRDRPNEHPSILCVVVSGWPRSAAGNSRPLPFKVKEIVLMQTKHETVLGQRRARGDAG